MGSIQHKRKPWETSSTITITTTTTSTSTSTSTAATSTSTAAATATATATATVAVAAAAAAAAANATADAVDAVVFQHPWHMKLVLEQICCKKQRFKANQSKYPTDASRCESATARTLAMPQLSTAATT